MTKQTETTAIKPTHRIYRFHRQGIEIEATYAP